MCIFTSKCIYGVFKADKTRLVPAFVFGRRTCENRSTWCSDSVLNASVKFQVWWQIWWN